MTTKKVIVITTVILLLILLGYLGYFVFIRPYITNKYVPNENDCKTAYDCMCDNNTCLCSYARWGKVNKFVCKRDLIKNGQIKN